MRRIATPKIHEKGQIMFRILLVVTLLWAAHELNLNQDCDGRSCNIVHTQPQQEKQNEI